MTAPSFVSTTSTAHGHVSPQTTASIAVQNGDVLVATAFAASDANGSSADPNATIATNSGSTSAWTVLENPPPTDANLAYLRTWTATATATGNITVNFSATIVSSVPDYAGVVTVWRNSNGIGNHTSNNNGTGSGSPTITVTTSGNNSALFFACSDWNAVTGTVTFTASNGTPVTDVSDQTDTGAFSYYAAHVTDAGAAGSNTLGMSAPNTQRYVATVIEVLGISSNAPVARLTKLQQAVKRASYW